MNLSRAERFFRNHSPVAFPPEELTRDFSHAIDPALRFADDAYRFLTWLQNHDLPIEPELLNHLETMDCEDPFTYWLGRALFAARFAQRHQHIFGIEGERETTRLFILLQRELVNTLLHLDLGVFEQFMNLYSTLRVRQELWQSQCAGARAVTQVIISMIRPNRMFFHPRIDEDMHMKIDLIILDANAKGVCCQIKGTKQIDGEIHVIPLTEPPKDDEYLRRFYEGTERFNRAWNLKNQPVVFNVGW